MPLYAKIPDKVSGSNGLGSSGLTAETEVDVIIAGGGLAGCVIASRLAEADPNLSILVLEQGPNNYEEPQVVHPALYPRNLFPNSKYTLFWQGNKSEHLAGRSPIVPSGGTLGGGSAINWMVYTRGQRSDFDSWNSEGWRGDDVLPYMKKMETYSDGKGTKEHHGDSGPTLVSKGTHVAHGAEDSFMEAAAKVGFPEIDDLQTLDANNGIERYLRYVGPSGRRSDSAHKYLHPKLRNGDYPNLHVLVEKQVIRVLFDDNKKAVGVEYQHNPRFLCNPEFMTAKQTPRVARAKKLVILSTGANATPLILERSGVGDPKILERAGVPLVEDLPGVGHDYQDHHLSLWAYRTSLTDKDTINKFQDGRADIDKAIREGDPLLGTNAMDAQGKCRPTEEQVDALGPEFRKAWDRDFKGHPDRPLMILAMYLCYYGDHSTLPDDAEYISQANWTAYPYSRGHIHITGKDVLDPIDFNVGYLTDKDDIDLKKHVWAYKVSREIYRRMSIFRGEHAGTHPRFPEGSKAAVIEKTDGPIAEGDSRIEYTKEDDAAIEQRVREIVSTTWHSLGTCKMAPREEKGVVDHRLNVHGIKGLKLADLSVPPMNVGANTGGCAFVVGERAADIFIEDLGLNSEQKIADGPRADSPQQA